MAIVRAPIGPAARRPPTLVVACIVMVATALIEVVGFAVLFLGRGLVSLRLQEKLAGMGLPPHGQFDQSGAFAAETASGAMVSFAVLVLAVLTLIGLRPARIAAWATMALALPWAMIQLSDGTTTFFPTDITAVYPGWWFPLNLAQGLAALACYPLASVLLALPRTNHFFRARPRLTR